MGKRAIRIEPLTKILAPAYPPYKTEIADANGDEVEDLAVIYRSGERQIIYRIPPPE